LPASLGLDDGPVSAGPLRQKVLSQQRIAGVAIQPGVGSYPNQPVIHQPFEHRADSRSDFQHIERGVLGARAHRRRKAVPHARVQRTVINRALGPQVALETQRDGCVRLHAALTPSRLAGAGTAQ